MVLFSDAPSVCQVRSAGYRAPTSLGSYSAEAAAQRALLWLGRGAVGSAQEAKQTPAHQTVYFKHPLNIKVRNKKATQ